MRIAGTMQETNQYTFQMPSAAVTVKVVFAQSQQPQAPGETPETGGMNGAQTEDMEGTGGMDSPRTRRYKQYGCSYYSSKYMCGMCSRVLYIPFQGKKQR